MSESADMEAPRDESPVSEVAAETPLEPEAQPGSDIPPETVAKFIKLPARPPSKASAAPQAPQVQLPDSTASTHLRPFLRISGPVQYLARKPHAVAGPFSLSWSAYRC